MNMKPKMGILFITSRWFRDVGLQSSSSPLTTEIEEIAKEIITRLSEFLEPVYHGVIFTEEEARNAAELIKTQKIDGLIVAPLLWCEDQILRASLKMLPKLPFIVCGFFYSESLSNFVSYQEMIKGSSLVGILQMSGMINREDYKYESVTGYYRDSEVYEDIKAHCTALFISQKLKGSKCGILPFRCDLMSTTFIDEFTLRKLYGIELEYIELQCLKQEAHEVSEDEIKNFTKLMEGDGIKIEVDEKNLTVGIKYAIAMEKLIKRKELSILVMNDIIEEMHSCFGMRPCLSNPRISDLAVVINMEADITAGVAMYILKLFTANAPFYAELFTADLNENAFLMGHPGYHDYRHRDDNYPVRIIPDVEYENTDPFSGACTYFKYKSGPITVVNSVYNGERIRWTVFEGYSLEGPPKMEGSCHLFCKINMPIQEFCKRTVQLGVSQHWIVVPGHLIRKLKYLCSWLGIEYIPVL